MDAIRVVTILQVVVEEVDRYRDMQDHVHRFYGVSTRRNREEASVFVGLDQGWYTTDTNRHDGSDNVQEGLDPIDLLKRKPVRVATLNLHKQDQVRGKQPSDGVPPHLVEKVEVFVEVAHTGERQDKSQALEKGIAYQEVKADVHTFVKLILRIFD